MSSSRGFSVTGTLPREAEMFSPQGGARIAVSRKRGPWRDRRCPNSARRFDSTTCESILTQREHARLGAKTLALRSQAPFSFPTAGPKSGRLVS